MYLIIDLSTRNSINITLFNKKETLKEIFEGQNCDILKSIDSVLKKNNLIPSNLKGIVVVIETGSFTSTRLAVVVGNTLSYTLKIPIIAVKKDKNSYVLASNTKTNNINDLEEYILKQPVGIYISAKYVSKPNISKPRCINHLN